MRDLRVLFISCMVSSNCLAMTNQDIHGVILDMTKNPIAYANIVLMTSDSTFISGCTTDDMGMYRLSHIPIEGKLLKVSAIGYDTKVIDISATNVPDTLVLENKSYQLGEVTIKSNKPMQTLSKGGIVTTVKGTVLSIAGNAVDVIGQMPGVRVEDEL